MSQENVEIVKQVYEAATSRDRDAVFALYDLEVEWDASRNVLGEMIGTGIYRGHHGLREWFLEWYEAWDEVEDTYIELIDADENVISVGTLKARGRESGLEARWQYAAVFTIHDGKILRVALMPTRAEALEAVGLSG